MPNIPAITTTTKIFKNDEFLVEEIVTQIQSKVSRKFVLTANRSDFTSEQINISGNMLERILKYMCVRTQALQILDTTTRTGQTNAGLLVNNTQQYVASQSDLTINDLTLTVTPTPTKALVESQGTTIATTYQKIQSQSVSGLTPPVAQDIPVVSTPANDPKFSAIPLPTPPVAPVIFNQNDPTYNAVDSTWTSWYQTTQQTKAPETTPSPTWEGTHYQDIGAHPAAPTIVNNAQPAVIPSSTPVAFSPIAIPPAPAPSPDADVAPSFLTIISGNNQSALINNAFVEPIKIQVLNLYHAPLANIYVNWSIASGNGFLSTSDTRTDSLGYASISVTAGSVATPLYINVSVPNLPLVTFTLTLIPNNTITPTPPTPPPNPVLGSIVKISGDNQTAARSSFYPESLVVRILDTDLNSMANHLVTWGVISTTQVGFSSPTSSSDISGYARVNVVAGNTGGNVIVSATTGSLTPILFNLTVSITTPPPVIIPPSPNRDVYAQAYTGNNQNTSPRTQFPSHLSVFVSYSDTHLKAPNERVEWTVRMGVATLENTVTVTDENGLTSIIVTAGNQSGVLLVVAHPVTMGMFTNQDVVFNLLIA